MNAWERCSAWLFRNDAKLVCLVLFVVMTVLGAVGQTDDLVARSSLSEQGTQAGAAVDVMLNGGMVVISLVFIVPLARSVRRDWARIG